MKKVFLLALLVMLLSSLVAVGCGGGVQPTGTATGTATATSTTPTKVYRLKFADFDPSQSIFIRNFVEPWCKLIERETGGRVVVDWYGVETLVKRADMHDAMLNGIADIVNEGPTQQPGRWPLFELVDCPFMYRSSIISGLAISECYAEGAFGNEYQDEIYFGARPNNLSNISSRIKFMKVLDDFKGQKRAASGYVATQIAVRMGSVGVALSGPDTYDAMQKGMIDYYVNEWEGTYIWRLYEVTKYRTDKCDMYTSGGTHYAMSKNTYNKLPADIQTIIRKYTTDDWWLMKLTSLNMDRESVWRRGMIKEYDIKAGNPPMYELPNDERERWKAALASLPGDMIKAAADKGLPAQATWDKLQEKIKKYEALYPAYGDKHWAMIAEFGYETVYPEYPKGFVMPAH